MSVRRETRPATTGSRSAATVGARVRVIVAAMLRHVVSALGGLSIVPLVAHALGVEALASWAVLGTAGFLLGVSDLGTSVAVQRATLTGSHGGPVRALRISLGVVLAISPLLACVTSFGVELPGLDAALAQDVERATPFVLLAGVIGALTMPIRGLVLVRNGMVALTRARTLAMVVYVGGTALGIALAPSLLAPAIALLASSLIELALVARAAKWLEPSLRLAPALDASRSEVLALVREGGAALAINLSVLASLRLDVWILGHFAPLAAVAGYGVASRAVDQSFTVAKQVSASMLSRLGNADDRVAAVRSGTGLLGALVGSGMVALALAAGPILELWAGEAARDPACATALVVLGAAAVLTGLTEMPAAALTLAGRSAWRAAPAFVAGAVLNVSLSVALAPHLGALGIAAGTVAGSALIAVVIWSRARALLGWTWREVGRAVLPAGAAAASAWALGAPLVARLGTTPLAALAIAGGVTLVGTGVGLWIAQSQRPATRESAKTSATLGPRCVVDSTRYSVP